MRAALDAPIRSTAAMIDHIIASGHPALVVFEKPGCGPCQSLRPLLDETAHRFEGRVLVLRVTDSSEGWLAARYHLSFVPTLTFWRGGAEQARIKGNPGHAALCAHLEYLLSGECRPEPAEGPRHILQSRFGASADPTPWQPRALLEAGAPAH
jgi:thioredoxin-like negative regulator of GroEL